MIIKYIKAFLNDSDRKKYTEILYDLVRLIIRYKEFPIFYFTRFAYRNNIDPFDFIPNSMFDKFEHKSNNKEYYILLNDKYIFHNYLNTHSNSLRLPNVYGLIVGGVVNINKRFISIDSELFIRYIHKLLNDKGSLVLKPLRGRWGTDILFITNFDEFYSEIFKIKEGSWIIQEVINQHALMNDVYPYSLNTLRIDTFYKSINEVLVLSSLLRFGVGGMKIDNVSSGGYFIGVNDNGSLKSLAYSYLNTGAKVITKHPDTGLHFEGFKIPFFKEAKSMVIEAAEKFPFVKSIGWDIGITDNGPVMIEGNPNYQRGMSEVAYGGYRKHVEFNNILEKYCS